MFYLIMMNIFLIKTQINQCGGNANGGDGGKGGDASNAGKLTKLILQKCIIIKKNIYFKLYI